MKWSETSELLGLLYSSLPGKPNVAMPVDRCSLYVNYHWACFVKKGRCPGIKYMPGTVRTDVVNCSDWKNAFTREHHKRKKGNSNNLKNTEEKLRYVEKNEPINNLEIVHNCIAHLQMYDVQKYARIINKISREKEQYIGKVQCTLYHYTPINNGPQCTMPTMNNTHAKTKTKITREILQPINNVQTVRIFSQQCLIGL